MVQEAAGGRVDSVAAPGCGSKLERLLRASTPPEEQVVRFFDRSIFIHRQPFQTPYLKSNSATIKCRWSVLRA